MTLRILYIIDNGQTLVYNYKIGGWVALFVLPEDIQPTQVYIMHIEAADEKSDMMIDMAGAPRMPNLMRIYSAIKIINSPVGVSRY